MSRASKTLERVIRGNTDRNIRFYDLCTLLKSLGFTVRIRGSHHIFTREGVEDILNLQPKSGMAKAYQVKQVRELILDCHLVPERNDANDETPPPKG
jgi:HicA toxin of bacterial toxin-antitoxin,